MRRVALAWLISASACDGARSGEEAAHEAAGLQLADTACREDGVRPATGAPAEGLWVYENPASRHRVAAMVGPAYAVAGSAHLTRRVETVETRPGADTIRHASDTAAVRLELVPPFARPAAVYPVSALVLVTSYEPCTAGTREPLLRYLRQTGDGQVAADVMLQRESQPQ